MGSRVSILLVEDDEVDVEFVQRALLDVPNCKELMIAGDGEQAIEKLRHAVDSGWPASSLIILLDLNLPRMNGLTFLEKLREDERLRPCVVFVLTTSNDARDKAAAFDKNVAGYFLKKTARGSRGQLSSFLNKYLEMAEVPGH